jgi:hypothetical protein
MTLVIELRRGFLSSRTARKPGLRPAAGTLERVVVDDEFWTAIERLGRHRLPTLPASIPTVTPGSAVRQPTGWCESWRTRISHG